MTAQEVARQFCSEFQRRPANAGTVRLHETEVGNVAPEAAAVEAQPDTQLALPLSYRAPLEVPAHWTGYPNNDVGNAAIFVARYGGVLRFVSAWKRWLIFGEGWHEDRSGEPKRLASQLTRELSSSALEISNEHERKAAAKRACSFGDNYRIESMLALAAVTSDVVVQPEELDIDPWALGTPNGVVDLRTGQLCPYAPERYVTKRAGCAFDAQAVAPRWRQFVEEIFDGDEALIRFIHKAAGYSLTGQMTEQCFFFLWGAGRNGKSKFIETIQGVMGDYGCTTAPDVVAQGRYETPEHHLATLHGARFVTLPETEESQRLAESRLKALVGGDRITGCRKYQHPFQFDPTLKLWIHGNHKPVIRGTDEGIWRRVRLVPFNRRFEGASEDRNLGETLAGERSGILNWIIEGCLLWQQEGLGMPSVVQEAVQEYRSDEDILGQFFQRTIIQDREGHIPVDGLYASYQGWTSDQNAHYVLDKNRFNRRVRERQIASGQGERGGIRSWLGISYNPELVP